MDIRSSSLPSRLTLLFLLFLLATPGFAEAVRSDLVESRPPDLLKRAEATYEFAQGKWLADDGEFAAAVQAFKRASDLDPSDPFPLIEAARLKAFLAQASRPGLDQNAHLREAAEFATRARALRPDEPEILKAFAQIQLRLAEANLDPEAPRLAQEAFEQLRTRLPGDLGVLSSLAQLYMAAGATDAGIEVLTEAVRFAPGNRMLLSMLVEAQLAGEKYADSEKTLAELIEVDPSNDEHRVRLAELLSRRTDHRGAIALLEVLPPAERSFRVQQILAREYHLVGRHQEALEILDDLGRQWNDNENVLRLRISVLVSLVRYEEALANLNRLPKPISLGSQELQDLSVTSRLHERLGQCDLAAEKLRQGAESLKGKPLLAIQLSLAGVLRRCDQAQAAVELLDGIKSSLPAEDQAAVAQAKAEILAATGATDEAIAELDRVSQLAVAEERASSTRLQAIFLLAQAKRWSGVLERLALLDLASLPELADSLVLLEADALAGLGRLEEAKKKLSVDLETFDFAKIDNPNIARWIKRWEIVAQKDPDQALAEIKLVQTKLPPATEQIWLGRALQRLELHDQAIAVFQAVAGPKTDRLDLLFSLAVSQERAGRRAEAITTFEQLLAADPSNTSAANYLGYMLAEKGEGLARAESLIRQAVSSDPDNGAYVDSLGWVFYQLGKFREAKQHLEWAARLVQDDATVFEHLGAVYAKLGLKSEARKALERALQLSSDRKSEIEEQLRHLDTP